MQPPGPRKREPQGTTLPGSRGSRADPPDKIEVAPCAKGVDFVMVSQFGDGVKAAALRMANDAGLSIAVGDFAWHERYAAAGAVCVIPENDTVEHVSFLCRVRDLRHLVRVAS